MDSITNYISEENDMRYRRGEKKGMEKGIEMGKGTVVKIAELTNVTEGFVKKVRKTLKIK